VEKVDYLRFLAGHSKATVAEGSAALGASEAAVLSAFKRLVRGKLAESSGSPPRFRLTPEGEARLRVLSAEGAVSHAAVSSGQVPDAQPRVAAMEREIADLARRVADCEAAEEEIAEDLETVFGAVDRVLDSVPATTVGERAKGLLERAEKLGVGNSHSEQMERIQQLLDAHVAAQGAGWLTRQRLRQEAEALESGLPAEIVSDVKRLAELEPERDRLLTSDEKLREQKEILSLREKMGLPVPAGPDSEKEVEPAG